MQIVIDKENLINVFSIALYIVSGKLEYENVKNTATELIEQVGYIPFSEPKTGEWVDENGDEVPLVKKGEPIEPINSCYCSVCGDWLVGSDEYFVKGNFCPNCGADMRGGFRYNGKR